MSSAVLEFFRQSDERFRQVPDAELTRFVAETQPDFLQDEEFSRSVEGYRQQAKASELQGQMREARAEQSGLLGSRMAEKAADFGSRYILEPVANVPSAILNLPAMAGKAVGLLPDDSPLPFRREKPIVDLPRFDQQGGDSAAKQIGKGAVNALASVAESLTTPENLMALPAAGIKAGTSLVRPLAEMTFAGIMGSQIPGAAQAAGEASVSGTLQEKAEAYTGLGALTALTAAPVLPALKQAKTREIQTVAPETARALEQVQTDVAKLPEGTPTELKPPVEPPPVSAAAPEPTTPTAEKLPAQAPKTLDELATMEIEPAKPEPAPAPVAQTAPTGLQIQKAIDSARRGEGGFIDPAVFQSIVDFGRGIYKQGMKFADWSASMLKTLGPRVKEFLEDAWDSIRGVLTAYDPKSGAYIANSTRRSILQAVRGPSGALPKSIRSVQEITSARRQAVEERVAVLARDIKGAFDEAFKDSKTREADIELLDDVMSGRRPLADLPTTRLQEAASIGRQFVDALSTAVSESSAVSPELRTIIQSNRGQYWRRQYMAFDKESGWTYDGIVTRIGRGDKEAKRRFDNMKSLLQREHPDWTDAQIEGQMRSLVDRAQDMTSSGGAEATTREWAADVSSLMKRNDLPVEVREWLGEIRDPFAKMSLTGKWMAQFLARQESMQDMAQVGLETGLFSTEKAGRYSEQLYPDELDLRMVKDDTGTPLTTEEKQIVAEFFTRSDKSHHPLRNLYTTKQMADALREFEGPNSTLPTTLSQLGRVWSGIVSLTKKGQVPLNPGSWMVNILGGGLMNVVGGHWNPKLYGRAIEAVLLGQKTKGGRIYNLAEKVAPGHFKRAREEYMTAVRQGLIDAGVLQSEIRELSQAALKGESVTKAWERVAADIKEGTFPNPKDLAVVAWKLTDLPGEIFIAKPDNVMRLSNFLGNLELSQRAFPSMEPNARMAWATERARNTYQTYSKLPQTIRDLSKAGALNTYIQFKAELIRNTFWVARYAAQDISSGNPALVANGVKAMAGLTAVTAGAAYLTGLTRGNSDITPEQEEALRLFLPPWDRNEPLVHVGRDGNTLSYSPVSYLIPHGELVKIARAGWNSVSDPDKAMDEVGGIARDYFGPSSITKPAIESVANKRIDSGDKITGKEGAAGVEERINYFFANTVVPRMYYFGRDAYRGLAGIPGDYGKVNKPEDAFLKMAAVRVRNVDVDRAVFFKFREMERRWQDARSEELKAERRWKDFPDKIEEARQYAGPKKEELLREYGKIVTAAKLLGVKPETIRKAERDLSIPLALRRGGAQADE